MNVSSERVEDGSSCYGAQGHLAAVKNGSRQTDLSPEFARIH